MNSHQDEKAMRVFWIKPQDGMLPHEMKSTESNLALSKHEGHSMEEQQGNQTLMDVDSVNALEPKGFLVSWLDQVEESPTRIITPMVCDDVSFSPPRGLLMAGFAWKGKDDGHSLEIDENLVDTMVAWSTLGNSAKKAEEKIECVLEVDYRSSIPVSDLVGLASMGEFSLALTGLDATASPDEIMQYGKRLKEFSVAMLKASSFSKSLYPFSNEFEALFLSYLGKEKDALEMRKQWAQGCIDVKHPSGARVEYALKRTPLGREELKAWAHEALLEHFGSEEVIHVALRSLAESIGKRLERFVNEVKAQPKAKQDRFALKN